MKAWEQGFVPLLRRLAAQHDELPPVGCAQRPQQEAFKLGQTASLTFAPREIAELSTTASGKLFIKLFGLGMLGPNGPLPLHMTEQVRERVQSRRDHTLNNFLDLFHHRALSHQYRAWAQAISTSACASSYRKVFSTEGSISKAWPRPICSSRIPASLAKASFRN